MIAIFAGPTISHDEIKNQLDCECYPPVCHGDILKVLRKKPKAIGIIDGYFEGAPSVWHKEILYALDQGVHVFGSSSMGALRAAELHPFGMIGVGEIFEWYKQGDIEADDEVAVLHGPEEVGFMVASEPLVSIRATLALAANENVINETQKSALIKAAQKIFYKKRSWSAFKEISAKVLGESEKGASALKWIDEHRIDLKKRDALLMLETLKNHEGFNKPYDNQLFYFEWTHVWEGAYSHCVQTNESTEQDTNKNSGMVLNQLRLRPDEYDKYRDKALLAWLSNNPVSLSDQDIDPKQALSQFRTKNELNNRAQLIEYMAETELDENKLTQLMESESRLDRVQAIAGSLNELIIGQLILDGRYRALLALAIEKQKVLDNHSADLEADGIVPPQIFSWYFDHHLGVTLPRNLDSHLSRIGMDSPEEFFRLLCDEYLYCREVR